MDRPAAPVAQFETVGWVNLIRSPRTPGLCLVRGRYAAELLQAIGLEAQPGAAGYLLPESRVEAFCDMAELFDVVVLTVTIGGRHAG